MNKEKSSNYQCEYTREDTKKAITLLPMIYENDTFDVPLKNIKFVSKIHQKGQLPISNEKEKLMCVISPLYNSSEDYALVIGWADYHIALKRGNTTIKALIFNKYINRYRFIDTISKRFVSNEPLKELVSKNNDDFISVPITKINAPDYSIPKLKTKRNINFYQKYNCFLSKIEIDDNYNLKDGYSGYCAAKELGLETINVQMI